MTLFQSLTAFVVAASVLTITPGMDSALVLRTAAANGVRPAIFAGLGIGLGCLVWGLAVAIGLAGLLAASTLAFDVLKWIGAAYLTYLGLKLILKPRRSLTGVGVEQGPMSGSALRTGFITNILNPKIGVFYITFLPQFMPTGANVGMFSFLLACVHVLLTFAWFAVLIAATAPLSRMLSRPVVVTALDRVTGGVFILFGLKLALSRHA